MPKLKGEYDAYAMCKGLGKCDFLNNSRPWLLYGCATTCYFELANYDGILNLYCPTWMIQDPKHQKVKVTRGNTFKMIRTDARDGPKKDACNPPIPGRGGRPATQPPKKSSYAAQTHKGPELAITIPERNTMGKLITNEMLDLFLSYVVRILHDMGKFQLKN